MWKGRIPCQIPEEHSEISKLLLLLLLQGEDFVSGIAMNKSHASEGHSEMKSVAILLLLLLQGEGFVLDIAMNKSHASFSSITHHPSDVFIWTT